MQVRQTRCLSGGLSMRTTRWQRGRPPGDSGDADGMQQLDQPHDRSQGREVGLPACRE